MKRFISVLSLVLLTLSLLASCLGGGGGNNEGGEGNGTGGSNNTEAKTYRVSVIASTGATVTSDNPIEVAEGGSASFTVEIANTAVFRSVTAGTYNFVTKTLTVNNVTEDMRINFTVEDVGYDTTKTYSYNFHGTVYDTTSHENGAYQAGTRITVNAGLTSRTFAGWSSGAALEDGGEFLSEDNEYTFDLTPSVVSSKGVLDIYPNYTDANVMYYDLNGGYLNYGSVNMQNRTYYTVSEDGDKIKISISSNYLDVAGAASTFYDDGSFKRNGYVLTEYNTRADGTGEGYSLGSKFPMNIDTDTLYCIWSKDSEHADFEYEEVHYGYATGVTATTAPHWVEDGIKITGYNGSDATVVIPEKIDGKTVTAIGAGAFDGVTEMTTLVLSRFLLNVADGAFVGCTSLEKIYYPDSIFLISNDAFDEASWSGVKKFYVNATMAPRYSTGDGSFALKFTRLLTNSHKNRIIVIAGSSAFQGLSSEYLEALLDNEYCVVNFGTTRTTHGYIYLEAMQYYANENDTILYAPENSIYMLGEPTLYWKTLRDLEGMYNIFRHIDISGYENVLGAFCELNRGDDTALDKNTSPRYQRNPQRYEDVIKRGNMNEYGEYQYVEDSSGAIKRGGYVQDANYKAYYEITLNNRAKSRLEGVFSEAKPEEEPWQTSDKWCTYTDECYVTNINRAINAARSSGAKVYFSFAPVDADAVCEEAVADIDNWLAAYDSLIEETYDYDGVLGTSGDYIFHHKYFYDNAFHTNDYGRTWRTYTLYKDLAELFGMEIKGFREVGTDFEGCLFEMIVTPMPIHKVDYLD